jgi:hypothetical protein
MNASARVSAVPGAAGTVRILAGTAVAAALLLTAPVWPAPNALAQDQIRIDDFDKQYDAGALPKGWDSHKFSPTVRSSDVFFFQFGNGPEYTIHLKSGKNNSFTVGRDRKFKLKDYPFLEWEWRVTVLPKGGDVRAKAKDDQAGSMCVVHNQSLTGGETLCYLWENKGPDGTELTSTKREDSKYIILRAADTDETGQWFRERRNIYEDFKRLFGKEPNKDAVIGLMIDSDDTESSGEVFYRNILLKKP